MEFVQSFRERFGSVESAASLSLLGLVATLVALLAPVAPSPAATGHGPAYGRETGNAVDLAPLGVGAFSVIVGANGSLGEVGIPATFTAELLGGVAPIEVTWSDAHRDSGTGLGWAVTPAEPGNLTVQASAVDSVGDRAVGSYILPVLGPLSITFPASINATDAGEPVDVPLDLEGGVPPYRLEYALAGGPVEFANAPFAGSLDLLVTPIGPGPAYLAVNLSDALGGEARAVDEIATVAGPLMVGWDDLPALVEAGVPVTLRADAAGGTPPLVWSVLTAASVDPGSMAGGTLGSPGVADWTGTFTSIGNATVILSVRDARGFASEIRADLIVDGPLAVPAPALPSSSPLGASLDVRIAPVGGAPPYAVVGQASDGEVTTRVLSAGQNVTWMLTPSTAGNLTIALRATDVLGGIASVSGTVLVTAAPPPAPIGNGTSAPAADPLATAAGALGLGGCGVLGLVLWWRRRAGERAPIGRTPIDLSDLQRMFADGEPLERETLYLMGEEQGVTRSSIAAQLSEGRRVGRITVERGVTGEEVFRWVEPPSSPLPPEGHA